MSTKSPEDLAKEREARLAARKQASTKTATSVAAPSDVQPPAPPAAPAQRELVAQVVNIARLDQTAHFQMNGPFNGETENPHWVLMAEGEPLAKVALADQEKPDTIRKHFTSAQYATSVVEMTKKFPVAKVMASIKARPYQAVVKATEAFEALDRKYKADATAAYQSKAAEFSDAFKTTMALVAEAQMKNYIPGNPLKDALFTELKRACVADPVAVIERAFTAAFVPYMEETVACTEKWMGMAPEALADIKMRVNSMGPRPVQAQRQTTAAAPGTAVPTPSARGNVPITTAGAGAQSPEPTPANERERARSTFSFRERMHAGQMPPTR
jgi:hypothetical protein